MDRKLTTKSRDVGRKYVSGWEKKKKANEASANKLKAAIQTFLKLSTPESENMATSRETAETDVHFRLCEECRNCSGECHKRRRQ